MGNSEMSGFFSDAQRDLFDRLTTRHGLTAKLFARDAGIACERTARRVMAGESPLTAAQVNSFAARHENAMATAELLDHVLDGTGLMAMDLSGAPGSDGSATLDLADVAALQQVTEFVRMRVEHQADGKVSQAESDEQRAQINQAIRTLIGLRHDLEASRVRKSVAKGVDGLRLSQQ